MATTLAGGRLSLLLTPDSRGAPDALLPALRELLLVDDDLRIASQQVAERAVVDDLADLRLVRGRSGKVLLESDYLLEQPPLDRDAIWDTGGEREEHRQCLAALLRAGIPVRSDHVGGALMHINAVLSAGGTSLLTSANLAPQSIATHLNWALRIQDEAVADVLADVFEGLWHGGIRSGGLTTGLEVAGTPLSLAVGTTGEAVDAAVGLVEAAARSVDLAYFAVSDSARLTAALAAAAGRGVQVRGIVDGDQGTQQWNGLPRLRGAGAEVRYYPGLRTGALGRMHHKTMVVDGHVAHLSTANASNAAERSLEMSLTLTSAEAGRAVLDEIDRLWVNARVDPPRVL